MTNPRKRIVRLVRTIPTEEIPNFYENLKAGLLEQYKNKLGSHLNSIHSIHELINKEAIDFNKVNKNNKELRQQENLRFNIFHQKIDRSALIESVIILDWSISETLDHFQTRKLNKKSEEMKDWQKIEDGLNEYLKGWGLPKEFQSQRSLIKHFRGLRHQFAHNPIGIFSFEAREESFESFLKNLEGINLEDSYHALISGKAGVVIPYNLNSGKFLENFFTESSYLFFDVT